MIRSFDKLGLSTSFAEAYDPLDIKGVQLETLGFVSAGHAIGWNYFKSFNNVNIKFQKYLKHNARDLADMKVLALQDRNFDQLENFLEFEDFIGHSYYTRFASEYIERAKAAVTTLTNQQVFETASEFYGGGRSFE